MQSTEQILTSTPGNPQLPATSQTPSRVLVVEPHPTLRTVLVQRLRQDGHLAAAVGSAAEALMANLPLPVDVLVLLMPNSYVLPPISLIVIYLT